MYIFLNLAYRSNDVNYTALHIFLLSSTNYFCKRQVFREAAREGLEEQAKKMKATSSKKFQKPTLGQNVRIKITDDRAKMDPRSITAIITDIKDEEFYELGTKLGKLKALYTRNQFTLYKDNFLGIKEVGTEEKVYV